MTDTAVDPTSERIRMGVPTLHDMAQSAGVSLATASRVLNGSARKVAESYRERVEAAAQELDYTANLSALREVGRDVRADVALAGFDDIPTSRDVTLGLTAVRVPLEEMGYQALHAAVDESWEPHPDALRLEVLLRASTPAR